MPPRARHPVRSIVEWSLIRFLFTLLTLIPRRARLKLGRWLGLALYACVPRLRRMAAANLERAFGETRSPQEKARISKASFEHLGRLLCDMPVFSQIRRENVDDF